LTGSESGEHLGRVTLDLKILSELTGLLTAATGLVGAIGLTTIQIITAIRRPHDPPGRRRARKSDTIGDG
jgi:hypothetical protein